MVAMYKNGKKGGPWVASWLPLATEASSRNLGPTFFTISVNGHRNTRSRSAMGSASHKRLCTFSSLG